MKFKHLKHYDKRELAELANVTLRTVWYWEERDDIPLKYYHYVLPLVLSDEQIKKIKGERR